jgi:hypothetical protein
MHPFENLLFFAPQAQVTFSLTIAAVTAKRQSEQMLEIEHFSLPHAQIFLRDQHGRHRFAARFFAPPHSAQTSGDGTRCSSMPARSANAKPSSSPEITRTTVPSLPSTLTGRDVTPARRRGAMKPPI